MYVLGVTELATSGDSAGLASGALALFVLPSKCAIGLTPFGHPFMPLFTRLLNRFFTWFSVLPGRSWAIWRDDCSPAIPAYAPFSETTNSYTLTTFFRLLPIAELGRALSS